MLDKKIFLKGLKYLNDYYVNFKFDINDNGKLGVWFSVFEVLTDEDFTQLVKNYCVENIYAPQSPTHLFEYAKTLLKREYLENDEAWSYAISLLRSLNYDFRGFYAKCEYSIISSVVKVLEGELRGVLTESLPFVKKNFVELYRSQLEKQISETVLKGKFIVKSLAEIERKALNYSSDK